jgi:hypothetical protein
MIKSNETNIDKFNKTRKKFTLNKKKNKFIVKDGLIGYQISINPFRCPCSNFNKSNLLCEHVVYIILERYKIDPLLIKFFHLFEDFFWKNTFDDELNKNIKTYLLENKFDEECGICFTPFSMCDNSTTLHECPECKKFIHVKCLSKWLQKINKKHNHMCIYCNSFPYSF